MLQIFQKKAWSKSTKLAVRHSVDGLDSNNEIKLDSEEQDNNESGDKDIIHFRYSKNS